MQFTCQKLHLATQRKAWSCFIYRYCNTANQWTIICKMRTPRSECGCAVLNEKVYILGGYNWNASKRLSDVESFDTDTYTWTSLHDIHQPLTGVGAVALTVYQPKNKDNKMTILKEETGDMDASLLK